MAEMTPEEIETKKPYLEWGLTQKEYDYICDELLQRLPNYIGNRAVFGHVERALFL